jgi:hypothetical protein
MPTFGVLSIICRTKWIVKFIDHRVADRRMLRLIQKSLRAGVSEEGKCSKTQVGTPQGAVALPAAGKHPPALWLRSAGQALA